jgi:hypothetical protein
MLGPVHNKQEAEGLFVELSPSLAELVAEALEKRK